MQKLIVGSLSAAMLTGLSVAAQPLPKSYNVIDLGAIETLYQAEGNSASPVSSAFSINQSGEVVGYSLGQKLVNVTVNNVTTPTWANINQAVVFNVQNGGNILPLMETAENFGFGATTSAGLFAMQVNDLNKVIGFGTVVDTVPVYVFDDDTQQCVFSTNLEVNRNASFISDLDGQSFSKLSATSEYTDSFLLKGNNNWYIGYANKAEYEATCNNISAGSTNGLIYDAVNQTSTLLPPLANEEEGQFNSLKIVSVNESNQFLALSETKVATFNGTATTGTSSYWFDQSQLDPAQWNLVLGNGGVITSATDFNDNYIIGRGNFETSSNEYVAFYTDKVTNESRQIGVLNNRIKNSQATAINGYDQVVGNSQVQFTPTAYEPFVFDISANSPEIINLNSLIDCDAGWVLQQANDINDNGYIVGAGTKLVMQPDGSMRGEVRAFMLEPNQNDEPNQSCIIIESPKGGAFWSMILILFLVPLRRRQT